MFGLADAGNKPLSSAKVKPRQSIDGRVAARIAM
jgi:hypothetical protein